MPKQTGKSSLSAKLGSAGRKAYEAHKDDEIKVGNASLPEGIEGGVAQLVDCKFDVYKKGDNKGEFFFYAAGVVKEPKTVNGIPIEGLRTQIGPEPLCATPRSKARPGIEDHVAWVQNEIKKLGIDLSEVDFDDWESITEALKEEKPHFRFRTWKGQATKEYPNPRVNHEWNGVCEYDGEMVDEVTETEDEEEPEEDEEEEETEESDEESEEEESEGDDLDTLAEEAIAGDKNAAKTLTVLARKVGMKIREIEEAESWDDVVTVIRKAEGSEEESEEEEEGITPAKEDAYYYKPPKARKSLECEVTAVFAGKKTCNLKSLDDGRVFKGVPWSKLSETE